MTADELRRDHCRPLKGPEHRLAPEALDASLAALPEWRRGESDGGAFIERSLRFANFLEALAFSNALGWMAEREDHHPDLELGWGYCRVRFSTHDVGGISRNDLICAAKADALLERA